ncbi:MAG: Interferon-induced transrane protein [Actinomycetota bacterium]|nr:Interferon-induced transrane protein [Actinomycetota bacterium]
MSQEPQSGTASQVLEPAKTHTFWSVVAILFFAPTAVAAVFQSGKTYAANQAGDYAQAHLSSRAARKWQNITALVFIVVFILNAVAMGFR